ncbi:MAG: hypothetical protein JW803_07390 [Endomicrobiales bacterium]|nr:hypothetical protein [Endomicrobiales bacterium]
MGRRSLSVAAVLMFLTGSSWALETVSYRIKAMGDGLNGVVPDEYTDILANPGRLAVQGGQKQFYGKTGNSGRPITFGYFNRNKLGIVAEVSERISYLDDPDSRSSFNTTYNTWFNDRSQYTYKSHSEDIGLVFLKAGRRPYGGFGVSLVPQRTFSGSQTINRQIRTHEDNSSGIITSEEAYNSEYINESDVLSLSLNFGKYKKTAERECDKVFKITGKQTRNRYYSESVQYTNNDPDSNGLDWYGGYMWIYSPDITRSAEMRERKQNPAPRLGAGYEYRSRKHKGDNTMSAFVLSLSYQAERNEIESVLSNDYYRVLGTTTTSISTRVGNEISGDINTYALYAKWGSARKALSEKLLLAMAVSCNLSYVAENNSATEVIFQEETLKSEVYQGGVNLSMGIEYMYRPSLALRFGVSPYASKSKSISEVLCIDGARECSITDSYSQSSSFTAGAGFSPVESVTVDIYTYSDVLDLGNAKLQVRYAF